MAKELRGKSACGPNKQPRTVFTCLLIIAHVLKGARILFFKGLQTNKLSRYWLQLSNILGVPTSFEPQENSLLTAQDWGHQGSIIIGEKVGLSKATQKSKLLGDIVLSRSVQCTFLQCRQKVINLKKVCCTRQIIVEEYSSRSAICACVNSSLFRYAPLAKESSTDENEILDLATKMSDFVCTVFQNQPKLSFILISPKKSTTVDLKILSFGAKIQMHKNSSLYLKMRLF